ncbi:hypothetical protein ACVWZR_005899 [Bradyrhizobium sp. i1.3.1]
MIDIQSRAERLRAKPTLPKAAKATSSAMRTAKRAINRVGLRPRDMSEDCGKARTSAWPS